MIEPATLKLIGSIAQGPGASISAVALDYAPPRARRQLMATGLLIPGPKQSVVVSMADHDDEPVSLSLSPIDGRLGYFSHSAGWVAVSDDEIASYVLDRAALAARVVAQLDGSWLPTPAAIIPDAVWELGTARLPRRSQRVGIWFAPRLLGDSGMALITEAKRKRPASGLRIVLTFTREEAVPQGFVDGHQIVSIPSVVDFHDGLAIDPGILAGRLSAPPHDGRPLAVSADGGTVHLHGRKFTFTGSKQKAIIRALWAAYDAGEPECSTAAVLTEAECGPSVNTLAKLFKGRTDWREFITERDGVCWIHG